MAKPHVQLTLSMASGWASTRPGHTKYHYYDANGQSLCAYQGTRDSLTPWGDPGRIPGEACSSCRLHHKRGDHLEAARPGPATVLSATTRVRVVRGALAGAFGRIQRYDEQSRKYCVAFGSKFEFLAPTDVEEAPLTTP